MASQPPVGPSAPQVTNQALEVIASIDVDELIARLVNETRRSLNDHSQAGLTGQSLADAVLRDVEALSDVPVEQAGRGAAAEGFNLGRNLAVQDAPEAFGEVVRTEVLDANTCDPCRALDGKIVQVNSPDYWLLMPPNECEGRDLCRGFYMARG